MAIWWKVQNLPIWWIYYYFQTVLVNMTETWDRDMGNMVIR